MLYHLLGVIAEFSEETKIINLFMKYHTGGLFFCFSFPWEEKKGDKCPKNKQRARKVNVTKYVQALFLSIT